MPAALIAPTTVLPKPRWRGVSHQYAFFASLVAGVILVVVARNGRAMLASAMYAFSLSALFGVSALYHRGAWTARAERRMQRLDHSMIYVLIAGSATPFGLLTLSGTLATTLLAIVWGGAAVGIVMKLFWIDHPRWLSPVLYMVLGWAGVVMLPELVDQIGWAPASLLLAGGVLYSIGAAVYAFRRPDPAPAVFGYHEVFHALVIAAATAHYLVVAVYVLPGA
jgi:hemolysin III